ncbi:MAG TPA: LysM peptidoglycan-binding domain-containing protein [Mizugakiibacter sp.]
MMRRLLAAAAPVALLAACAQAPMRAPAPPPSSTPAPEGVVHAPPTPTVPSPAPDAWERLRRSFAMDDCDADADVAAWAQRYTAAPDRFEAQLQAALPLLRYVQAQAEAAGVPGEFVLLPWVESEYRALPGARNGPAGVWQIMPRTARALGLEVRRDYDGRLDVSASTQAALQLLRRYDDDFHDWRLADMAFNTGEYRIRQLVREHGVPDAAPAIPDLPVGRITREHLTRLLAMACIVRDPARFDVELPRLDDASRLTLVTLDAPIDLRVAARLAGMPLDALRALNPGYRHPRMPASGVPHHLLLPQDRAERFQDAYALADAPHWSDWADAQLRAPTTLQALAARGDIPATALAAANAVDADAPLAAGRTLLLPHALLALANAQLAAVDAPAPTHTTQPGESLWSIARRYHVGVDDLRAWNGLKGDALRPGRVLRLSAPD